MNIFLWKLHCDCKKWFLRVVSPASSFKIAYYGISALEYAYALRIRLWGPFLMVNKIIKKFFKISKISNNLGIKSEFCQYWTVNFHTSILSDRPLCGQNYFWHNRLVYPTYTWLRAFQMQWHFPTSVTTLQFHFTFLNYFCHMTLTTAKTFELQLNFPNSA